MVRKMSVVERYLEGPYLRKYSLVSAAVKEGYRQALDAVADKARLPYAPNVYVVPFVVEKQSPIPGTGRSLRLTYFNFAFLDVDNFERHAIYSPLDFHERFPSYVAAGFGHELAHFIAEEARDMSLHELMR